MEVRSGLRISRQDTVALTR